MNVRIRRIFLQKRGAFHLVKANLELKKRAEDLGLEIEYRKTGYWSGWYGRRKDEIRQGLRFGGWIKFAKDSKSAILIIDQFGEKIMRPDFYEKLEIRH